MKTIKQLADDWGIPKHKVKYQADKLSEEHRRIDHNKVYITDEGAALLREILLNNAGEETEGFSDETEGFTEEITKTLITMLQNELEAKNRQIEMQAAALAAEQEKNKELTNALITSHAAAHALHAGTIQTHLTDSGADADKPGLFARLFNRRKSN